MLLERLSIQNYGVYAGTSDFDLTTTPKKPIILIGGINGAGKTTIFECIMVALYGKTYLGRRTTKKEYLKSVAQRIHKHGGRRADTASVEIAFRFYHNGSEDGYAVRRSWDVEGASVTESLSVQKNGSIMSEVDESQWQSFIESLIPLGIARLFFIDGEKIVRITKWGDGDGNDEVRMSLDMLLGTELIKRLYADLDLYTLRKSGKKISGAFEREYEQLQNDKKQITTEIEMLTIEKDKKDAELAETASKIRTCELDVSGVGGGYVDIREDLLAQRAALEEKIRHQKRTIQEELSEDAPLYIVPTMLERIRRQIKDDTEITRRKAVASMVKEQMPYIRREILAAKFWSNGTNAEFTADKIAKIIEGRFNVSDGDEFFDMSPNDATRTVQTITELKAGRELLQGMIAEHKKTMAHFESVETELSKVPKDDEIGPRISKINALHKESGILQAEIATLDQHLSKKCAHLTIIQNKTKAVIKSIHVAKTADHGVRLASRMQDVLEAYSASLRERKMTELESNLLDTARLLLHKENITRITIDRKTFEIRVYGEDEEQIPGGLISMGEQQIVGTALLWAIARTSCRSLPFVIDSPLGRLDGEHLTNLTDRFYPFASHQLILLSTDREIGIKEYAKMSKHITRSYHITCDKTKSVTTVTGGYFVEEKQIA